MLPTSLSTQLSSHFIIPSTCPPCFTDIPHLSTQNEHPNFKSTLPRCLQKIHIHTAPHVLNLVPHDVLHSKFAAIEISVWFSVRCRVGQLDQQRILHLLHFTVAGTSMLSVVCYYHNRKVEWNKLGISFASGRQRRIWPLSSSDHTPCSRSLRSKPIETAPT